MLKKRKRSHLRRKRIPTSILLRSKRKVCPFKEAGIDRIDYKDVELLRPRTLGMRGDHIVAVVHVRIYSSAADTLEYLFRSERFVIQLAAW